MRMRSAVIFLAVTLPGLCAASESTRAFVFQGAKPRNLSDHERASALFKQGQLSPEQIPRPIQMQNSVDCGVGTTVLWERENSGRAAIADSYFKSSVVVFIPDLAADTELTEKNITIGEKGSLLYVATEHAGEICAGYATHGELTLRMLPDGSADVVINATAEKKQLTGLRSCRGNELSLSFKAKKATQPGCK